MGSMPSAAWPYGAENRYKEKCTYKAYHDSTKIHRNIYTDKNRNTNTGHTQTQETHTHTISYTVFCVLAPRTFLLALALLNIS